MTLRKISKTELDQTIVNHNLWLKSNGQEGSCADLSNTNLRGAVLEGAVLEGAVLEGADLTYANLQVAYLIGADLRHTFLEKADFRGAELRGADLRGTKLDRNILSCWTLKDTKWLKSDIPWFIQHQWYNIWSHTVQILDE
jgi:uncharacterized protein YjbI with pentapeptide repeats